MFALDHGFPPPGSVTERNPKGDVFQETARQDVNRFSEASALVKSGADRRLFHGPFEGCGSQIHQL